MNAAWDRRREKSRALQAINKVLKGKSTHEIFVWHDTHIIVREINDEVTWSVHE